LFGKQHAFVAGFRIYRGTSFARQGDGSNGSGPDFYFLHPEDLENSDYKFPNENYAAFVENIFDITPKLSVTPGIRVEHIRTYSEGYYKQVVYDQAGNVVVSNKTEEEQSRKRSFLLAGIGLSYKPSDHLEVYGNVSQNYRAINFTDLRIVNPNFVVDPNIQDEKGYTADMGIRGTAKGIFRYEATLFYISYRGRIGQVLRTDTVLYNDYRFRGNISDARNVGVEAFGEWMISKLIDPAPAWSLSVFLNAAAIDARYIHSKEASIENKKVEMVPPLMLRTGVTFRYKDFTSTLQYSYTGKHYSDATNAKRTASAVEGSIPAYQVVDLTASYQWKFLTLEASCNNLLNESYFTRRAESYPGPGIIPSDGRGFYVTLQAKIGK
jgi:Fe(3+) dicitrate transport protein